mgnify:CR=1 FL=1
MITLLYIIPCIFLAWLNAKWIYEGKKIKHFWNGLIHFGVAGVFILYHWYHFFTILLIARLSFDVSLNIFRGLPINYVPIAPKSIIDKMEKRIFGNDGITPKILYLALIAILILC